MAAKVSGGTTRKKAPQSKGDQGDRVHNLVYSRELPIDDGITLNVNSRPLHTVVDPRTLPIRHETFYDPKGGNFRTKTHREDADEGILRNAQRHQGRLSCHMDTGYCVDPATQGKNSRVGGVGGMIDMTSPSPVFRAPRFPSNPKSKRKGY